MTRIAALQMTSTDDANANLKCCHELIRSASGGGAQLIGLPENFAFFGAHERAKLDRQEALDGPVITDLRRLAAELKVSLILGGFAERSDDAEKTYNTSIAINAQGEIMATYRKIHLFDVNVGETARVTESLHTRAGDQPVVCSLAGLQIGLSICYDLRFAALYDRLVQMGAELLSVPAAFTLMTGKDHWEVLLRARAIEFQSYVMAPAQFGRHNPKRHSYGSAMIIDPWGTVLARCAEQQGYCMADADLDYLRDVRARLPSLQHRRDIAAS